MLGHSSRYNLSFLKTLILCFNVQKFFILAFVLLYFTIYVILFLYYGADFGYLSGMSDAKSNLPELVIAIFDVVPKLSIALILTYTTFSVHQNYMRDQKANLTMLKNALDNRSHFKLFVKQYIMVTLIILALIAIAIPLFFMGNIFIKIMIAVFVISVMSVLMAKPYISLYYKRSIGIVDIYHIMESVLLPYICSFVALLMIIFIPIIIGKIILDITPSLSIVFVAFDFITAFMVIVNHVLISTIVAYFSYQAISCQCEY